MPRKTFTFEGRRIEVTAKTEEELIAKVALKKRDLEEGRVTLDKNTLVKKWAYEWLNTYKSGAVGHSTYKKYEGILKNHILPSIGNLKIKDVRPVHLQNILNKQDGKSKDHIERVRYTLQQIFTRALYNKMILENPAVDLVMPCAEDGSHRSITTTERKYMLQLAETHYYGIAVKLMLYCGLRPGEVCALTWSDIDFKRRRICIKNARESKTNKLKAPKTRAGIREIPIPDVFFEDLKRLRGLPNVLVFPNRHNGGCMYSDQAMYRAWKNFKRELDILMGAEVYRNEIVKSVVAADLVPYCLRHTYCTDLQDAGVDINVAKELMGHTDIKVTANIYTHHSEVSFTKAADLINYHQNKLAQRSAGKSVYRRPPKLIPTSSRFEVIS